MATTKKTRIITVVNHKGGVGKTMTAANLGAALAKMGKTVLLVDADGQCNLTMQSVEEVTVPTLSDYLNNDDIEVNPQQVSKKLFLIPGSTALDADSHNIELSIEEDAGATKYMSEWLEKVKGEYDYVIIDSAPGSGAMLVNVIVAADELIIPIADKFSIPGAKKLTQIIRSTNKEVRGHHLRELICSRNRELLCDWYYQLVSCHYNGDQQSAGTRSIGDDNVVILALHFFNPF